jgi:hypothetical protein
MVTQAQQEVIQHELHDQQMYNITHPDSGSVSASSSVLPIVCTVLIMLVIGLSIEILRSKKLFITLLKKQ